MSCSLSSKERTYLVSLTMYINDQTQIYFKAGGPHRLALKPLMYTANSYECIEKYFFWLSSYLTNATIDPQCVEKLIVGSHRNGPNIMEIIIQSFN